LAATGIAFLPWRSSKFVCDQIKPFFDSDVYSPSILKGIITCSGGLTESTLKASQGIIFEYLSEMSKMKTMDGAIDKEGGIAHKKKFIGKLISLYNVNAKIDRVTVPLMKTTEMMLAADYLSEPEIQPEINELHRLVVSECNKSKNITKLISGVGVFAGMMNSPDEELCR